MDQLLNVLVFGLLLGGIYGLVSIGLNLIFGVVRIVNFAQGELVMFGMYGSYYAYAHLGLDPYVSVFIVAPLVGLIGVAIQRLVIQPLHNESNMQIFATFGLLMMFQNIMLALSRGEAYSIGGQVGSGVIEVAHLRISIVQLVTLVATTLITIGLHLYLRHTMMGKAIRAVTQDKRAARVMGINVERTFLFTFGIGACAGRHGWCTAHADLLDHARCRWQLHPGGLRGGGARRPGQCVGRLHRRADRGGGGGLRRLLHRPGAQERHLVHHFPGGIDRASVRPDGPGGCGRGGFP
jgi:branched-subunit amino acid ABC-type transport system permease component